MPQSEHCGKPFSTINSMPSRIRALHRLSCYCPKRGDFLFALPGQEYGFEIGGPNKEAKQIGTAPHHYVVVDSAATAQPQRIPLWMLGLLY